MLTGVGSLVTCNSVLLPQKYRFSCTRPADGKGNMATMDESKKN